MRLLTFQAASSNKLALVSRVGLLLVLASAVLDPMPFLGLGSLPHELPERHIFFSKNNINLQEMNNLGCVELP